MRISHQLVQQAREQLDRLRHLAERAFGKGDLADRIGQIVQEGQSELERADKRLSTVPTVVVVPYGDEETEWARRLFVRRASRPEAPRFVSKSLPGSTRRALVDHVEAELADLGCPYAIHFVPPLYREERGAVDAPKTALAAHVVLCVVPYSRLRDGRIAGALRSVAAGCALPVVLADSRADTVEESDLEAYWLRWSEEADKVDVRRPILVDVHAARGNNGELQRQLAEVLADSGSTEQRAERAVQRVMEQVGERCLRALEGVRGALKEPLRVIEDAKEEVLAEVKKELMPPRDWLRVQIRHRLRVLFLSNVPPWAFPFRTIVGTLVLTAGAWDRLVLSAFGLWRSALPALGKAVTNVKEIAEWASWWRRDVKGRCTQAVNTRLRHAVREMRLKLWKLSGPEEQEERFSEPIEDQVAEVRGVEELVQQARANLDRSIASCATSPVTAFRLAVVATVLFAGLIVGPLIAAYTEYLAACKLALQGQTQQALQRLPSVPWIPLFSAFLYSVLPVFVLALAGVGLAARSRHVEEAVDRALEAQEEMFKNRLRDELHITITDPKLCALQQLIGALEKMVRGVVLPLGTRAPVTARGAEQS